MMIGYDSYLVAREARSGGGKDQMRLRVKEICIRVT